MKPPDIDTTIFHIQYGSYPEWMRFLVDTATRRYQRSCSLLDVKNDLCSRLSRVSEYELGTLRSLFELLAANDRASLKSPGQLALFTDGAPLEQQLAEAWRQHFLRQVETLVEQDDAMVVAVLNALAYHRTPARPAALRGLEDLVEERKHGSGPADVYGV